MPVRRRKDGRWRYRPVIRLASGERVRLSGSAPRHENSRVAAEEEMRSHIDRVLHPERHPKPREEVMTFAEWSCPRR